MNPFESSKPWRNRNKRLTFFQSLAYPVDTRIEKYIPKKPQAQTLKNFPHPPH
jgi:hypothetical protein